MYKRSRVNVKVLAQPLRLQAALHILPLFYLRARAHAGKNHATGGNPPLLQFLFLSSCSSDRLRFHPSKQENLFLAPRVSAFVGDKYLYILLGKAKSTIFKVVLRFQMD